MRVIITCGPSFEPIDGVRRLTNFSTGELGLLLSAELSRAGHDVICLKGEGAVSRADFGGARVIPFSTNADLLARLRDISTGGAGAVFHAAALCDYRVKTVCGSDGAALKAEKLPSRSGELTLTLEPAVKLLPELRAIFPAA
ncbi:MAG: phosphopantothenoylcysteine decarboxylase, partial [Chthoniobacteraceae bacterium]